MKIFQSFLAILVIFLIVFLGGAYLLPDKQYFTETRIIPTDPVAVYSKLKDTSVLNHLSSEIFPGNKVRFELRSEEKFKEINYLITSQNEALNVGFLLSEENEGTQLTGYFQIDSLGYPLERWKGFFITFFYKKPIEKGIDKLEQSITR